MKKWFVLFALFLIPSCASGQVSNDRNKLLLQDETVDGVKIGDKINVEPMVLEYAGQQKTVNGQIILPDGNSLEGKAFTIEMPGIYTVNYRAFFGTHEESVSIFYHCHRTSGDFFISSNKSNPAQSGEYSHPITNGSIKGAVLTLDSKTTYTFDGEIDFSSYNSNNSFIEFIIDTSEHNTSDIETFTIRLTDTEDINNFVDITVTDSGPIDDDGRGCYMLAGSNSQFKTGFEGGRNGKLWTSKYGTNVGMSFRDLPEKSARVAKLYFDYLEKELYVSSLINTDLKGIVTDLDDKSIYGTSIWEGFKSGKATLSIFANSLYSNNATLLVSKIANHDLSPLEFVDTDSPVIKVNFNGQSSITVPNASVNKPYKIYDASISDNFNHHLSYSTYVTYEDIIHGVEKDISINDGYFTPKQAGTYTITYYTKDYSLNEATKTVEVTAINDPQEVHIDLDIDTINQELYSVVNLPSTDEVKTKISGGSGKSSIERIVLDQEGNPFEIEGDSFVPTQIGEYKAIYKATDYIENVATATLTINITDPGHPVFVDELSLPRILIKGHEYTLPIYHGAEVVDGKTQFLNSQVYIDDKLLENNTFVADKNCTIKYVLNGTSGNVQYSENVDVVDCGSPVELDKYFQGNFTKELNKNDITLSASSGDAHDLFASLLPYKDLYLKFALDEDSFNCDELIFKFSDSTNKNNSISFHVKIKNDNTYISIGDSDKEYLFSSFAEKGNITYVIDFSSSTKVLKDVLHKDIEIVNYNDQGELFNGFGGGVYLDITMKNIKSESSFKMLYIANQPFGHLGYEEYEDGFDPIIIFKNDFISEQSYGDNAYLPAVEIFDVLGNASITVSVKAPDGTYKIENAHAREEHTFVLDQFGNYAVSYIGQDESGNEVPYPRQITVYDFVAPELTITGSLNSTYGLNSSISIPSYVVNDNLNDYTLDVFLIMPSNEIRLLMIDHNGQVTSYLDKENMYYNASFKVDSRTFKAEQYGHYVLRFVAYDSDFNKTVKELYFDVK